MRAVPAVVMALSLLACGGPSGNDDDDADDTSDAPAPDAAPDAVELPACSAFGARTTPLEAFVAPVGLRARMDAFIDGAQDTLDVQMYLFTVTGLVDKIIAAKNRGVAVRVLLDPDHDGNATARSRLTGASVPNRNAPNIYDFSHAKYLIADGDRAIIMSSNFNVDAMSVPGERNYGVLDRDADDLADLQAVFEQDWAAGGGETPRPADLACTRLVVSPTNSAIRIRDLIGRARSTLDVEALYVAETSVRDAIVAAKERGVMVRVILEASEDDSNAEAYFESKGIPVHDASSFYLHAKLIIADQVAFVGSENFSVSGLTRNREMGVFVTEAAQTSVIQTQFDTDWAMTQ